jgi:hypothetical protein
MKNVKLREYIYESLFMLAVFLLLIGFVWFAIHHTVIAICAFFIFVIIVLYCTQAK